ncbi:MAG: tyrosine-type recombinase/integrase [Egibacteraceae bacterium]
MSKVSGVEFSGPLESYASGLDAQLSRLGYTPGSAEAQLRLLAHLSRWLAEEGLAAVALTPQVVESFVAVRWAAGYRIHRSPAALAWLLDYLRDLAVLGPPAAAEPTPLEALLDRYRNYLTGQRGLAASSVRVYVGAVRPFLAGRMAGEGLDLERLTAGDVIAFVLEACSERRTGKAKTAVTAPRSLLGFLHLEGMAAASLAAAVPSAASWRLAGLPRGLEPDEVDRLLAARDRSTVAGRRDAAILSLLVRLGLRAGEVAGLELDDIDWRAGQLVVRGKGDRHERLPLPDDVGRAVVGYLRDGRPATAQGRCLFVRLAAPYRRLTSGAVSAAVFAAGQRAGLGTVRAHRLRHTAATRMLAAGAGLTEIGQLLRHRKASTTAIYAKVDRDALSILARPWPGGVR